MAVNVDPLQKRRLQAVARLHDQFVRGNLDAPFHPEGRPEGSDYNQHHVDIEAPADAEEAFYARALQIVRGELDDELDSIGVDPA